MTDHLQESVLIADDEVDVRKSFCNFLSDFGYMVFEAGNGRECLEITNREKPDLILVDLHMPELNGMEVLARVKESSPDTPVIVVSGTGVLKNAIEALRKGAWDYILKPVEDMSVLLHAVEKSLERARLILENRSYQLKLEEKVERKTKELRRAIAAQRVSEEKYRRLIEHANDGICIVQDELLRYANHQVYKFTGYSPDEIINTHFERYIHPAEVPRIQRRGRRFLAGKENVQRYETVLLQKDGNGFDVEFNISSTTYDGQKAFLIFVSDITERKHAEEALRESEEKYRLIYEHSPFGIMCFQENGTLTDCNNKFAEIMGVSREELVGFNLLDSMAEPVRSVIEETIKYGIGHFEGEYPAIKKDRDIKIRAIHKRINSEDGKILGAIGIFEDITEKKNIEEQLQQARRMEAISSLAGGIAHQFNNALVGITGNIELLKMAFPDEENIEKYAGPMKTSVNRMTGLTSQLLAYAQGGKYNPQTLILNQFVNETLFLVQHRIAPEIRIVKDLPGNIYKVEADPTQIQMVLTGVIENAAEAIKGEGCIKIGIKNVEVNNDIAVNNPILKPGNYTCTTIEDNGKGMDMETLERVFEPFFTTNFQGRGLGMAAVYGIIKNHNGWISIDSEPGMGTIVRIYLPALDIPVEKPAEKKIKISFSTGTVMVIEDEEMVMDVSCKMLENLGYRALPAKNGIEAVKLAETFDGVIDLAILDIGLPDIEGKNVFLSLVKARPSLKVIVCSGYSIDGPAEDILAAGAHGYIQKPFTFSELSERLKTALESR